MSEFDNFENENFEDEFVPLSLLDEEGNETHFEILDEFEYKNENFVVLLPYEEEDDEVVILKVIYIENDDKEFKSIEDEQLLNSVFDEFKKRNSEYYDFKD